MACPRKVRPKIHRHEAHCSICAHPDRSEIESEYVQWQSPGKIAVEHELRDRSAVYRHARALGLDEQRARNLRGALSRIIERADDAPVSAGAVVAAIGLLSKINARGELVEPREQHSLNELFGKMSRDELLDYAKSGTLPGWFTELAGAETSPAQENDDV